MHRRTLFNLIPIGVAAACGVKPAKAEYVHGFEVVRIKADLMTIKPNAVVTHSFLGETDCYAELLRDGISTINIPVHNKLISEEELFNHPRTIKYLPSDKNLKIYVISCGDKVNYIFSESKLEGLSRRDLRKLGLNSFRYTCPEGDTIENIWHQEAKRWV